MNIEGTLAKKVIKELINSDKFHTLCHDLCQAYSLEVSYGLNAGKAQGYELTENHSRIIGGSSRLLDDAMRQAITSYINKETAKVEQQEVTNYII